MSGILSPVGASGGAAWQSNLLLPTGALAETFPRINAGTNFLITSTATVIGAVPVPAGVKISNITVVTGTQAELGGSHGFVGLLDNTGKVLVMSADQVSATWLSPASSPVTTALTAPFTTTAAGTYFVVLGVTATTAPNLTVFTGGASDNAPGLAPFLGGNAGTGISTPPAVGSTMTLSANTNSLYAYLS